MTLTLLTTLSRQVGEGSGFASKVCVCLPSSSIELPFNLLTENVQ